jgi:hypothetical protein
MPLFLGGLRPRPPAQYTAILAYRPERVGPAVDALVATQQSSAAPLFSVLVDGRAFTLVGYSAVFHAVLALLALHRSRYAGRLGAGTLSDDSLGRLAEVIGSPDAQPGVPQSVFSGWWS